MINITKLKSTTINYVYVIADTFGDDDYILFGSLMIYVIVIDPQESIPLKN